LSIITPAVPSHIAPAPSNWRNRRSVKMIPASGDIDLARNFVNVADAMDPLRPDEPEIFSK
jgi:hypothetical protein